VAGLEAEGDRADRGYWNAGVFRDGLSGRDAVRKLTSREIAASANSTITKAGVGFTPCFDLGRKAMRISVSALCAVAAISFGNIAFAADMAPVVAAKDVKWGPAPPALPPGAQMAVMAGDPAKSGFVSLRAMVPAGYTIPPHTHPTDEHVTVLSGSMSFGTGDKVDPKTATTAEVGGYFNAMAGMHHYATTQTGAVLQIDLIGPFAITYINPADDPRNKKKP
jgi:quercetin dioxygenase-like cupin family protein